MMTRKAAVAVVAAAARLATQASAQDYDVPVGSTPSPVSSGDGEKAAAVYLGCFHDNKGDRVLGDKFPSPDMTHEVCVVYCTELGAAFMATQWGFECWCSPDGGLDYNRHYEITGEDAVCDMPCEGDESEICGGFDSFELYKLTPACSGTPVEVYEQCGGLDWTGSTCCSEGYECVDVSGEGCYSQCRPMSTEETTPSPIMEAATPAPVAIDRRTAAPVTAESVPLTPETEPPVAAPTPSPVAPETESPVPAPTPPPVAPETEPPVPAPTPPPVAPETEPPVAAPTSEPVTPTPRTPTPGTGAPPDMQDLLDLHNEARCIHNADPLTWSSEVEASAARYAKVLSDACNGLTHSNREDDRNGWGENLYWCGGSGGGCYSAERAMKSLYEEEILSDSVTGYDGHATQILWKATEKLGCAISECVGGGTWAGTYLVCQYDPTGNVTGQYEEQVDLPTNAGNC